MKQTNQTLTQTKKKKNLRPVFQTVLLVIIALALGFGIYHWNAKTIGRNALPMPFGIGMAVVVSGSMEPELSVNDLILVKEADSYQVKDVIVFWDGSSLVVHRIIKIDGDTVITQGDANNTPDAPISTRDIKGVVFADIPSVGVVVDFIKSVPGTLMILLLAAYLYFRSIKSERQEADSELERIREEIEKMKKQ